MTEYYGHYYTILADKPNKTLTIIPKRGSVVERTYSTWLVRKLQKATKHQLDDLIDELWS